ncbi:MAG TPA: peptidylprolyl isomerase [Candidatus Saccharimonadales bacterium]|nr:peptidylprolyl isomerase [Candidatus Saccharimonadales bacterium]
MKKILFFLSIVVLAASLSACTTEPNESAGNTTSLNSQTGLVQNQGETTSARTLDNQKDLAVEYSQAVIETSAGDITVKFYPEAPLTVNNFMNLAQDGFYNGTKFHRVMKDFMIQGGDPLTKNSDASAYGTGGPGYQFKNETSGHNLVAGNIAMANAGPNTNGSQFFIVTATSTPFLDGGYTNFGEVVSGMDVVREIENSAVIATARGEMSVPVNYVTVNSVQVIK